MHFWLPHIAAQYNVPSFRKQSYLQCNLEAFLNRSCESIIKDLDWIPVECNDFRALGLIRLQKTVLVKPGGLITGCLWLFYVVPRNKPFVFYQHFPCLKDWTKCDANLCVFLSYFDSQTVCRSSKSLFYWNFQIIFNYKEPRRWRIMYITLLTYNFLTWTIRVRVHLLLLAKGDSH